MSPEGPDWIGRLGETLDDGLVVAMKALVLEAWSEHSENGVMTLQGFKRALTEILNEIKA